MKRRELPPKGVDHAESACSPRVEPPAAPRIIPMMRLPSTRTARSRSLRLAAQDTALSRRGQGFDSPRERQSSYLVSVRKPPLLYEISDEPPHFRRGFGHGTSRTDTTEGCSAPNRSTFPTSGHRRPFPSPCAGRGGRKPQEMAALRPRGVFDVVRPHACAVARAGRCGAGWRPVSTMQRCVQNPRRRGSAPDRDRDARGC